MPNPTSNTETRSIAVGVAHHVNFEAACREALSLAILHELPLRALGLIDSKRLGDIGPVPLGGGYHARELRAHRMTQARRRLSESLGLLEELARQARVELRVQVEEGDARALLRAQQRPLDVWVMPRGAWFDQGLLGDTGAKVKRSAGLPFVFVSQGEKSQERAAVVFDGTEESLVAGRWFMETDLWSALPVHVFCPGGTLPGAVAKTWSRFSQRAAGAQLRTEALPLAEAWDVVAGGEPRLRWYQRVGRPRGGKHRAPITVLA